MKTVLILLATVFMFGCGFPNTYDKECDDVSPRVGDEIKAFRSQRLMSSNEEMDKFYVCVNQPKKFPSVYYVTTIHNGKNITSIWWRGQ